MKGTEQSSSPTYPFQGHPSHHLSTPPLQVHEEDRQGGRRGTLGGVGGEVAQVTEREEGEEKGSFLFAPYFLS